MKSLVVVFCALVVLGLTGHAAEEVPREEPQTPAVDARLPGVVLSEGISQITGTAVSPLLGMSAVGAWKYFNTPADQRHLLPWYCHHWVWGSFAVVLALCFTKDVLGAAVPALVKKPLDFVELFEDKLSALVVSGAFVPLIASTMAKLETGAPADGAAVFSGGMGYATVPMLAMLDGYWAKFALFLPLCLGGFLVVWLACHSINVIIAMSPFGLVDIALKLFKAGLLLLITAAAFISPFLGLLVCVPLIVVAFFISGWTFRLTVFGTVIGLDVLSRRKADSKEVRDGRGVLAFNARAMAKAPVRSLGRVCKEADGSLRFEYRPWLVMPKCEVVLDGPVNGIERGVLFPSMMCWQADGRARRELVLLPRYGNCVPQVAARYGLEKVTDSLLVRGFNSAKQRWSDVMAFVTGKPRLAESQMG
ncbi:hypothetical protein FEM03_19330 [Phragmitibacter flavus]|uniref:Uncharacterized protein n=1 Tax=Phragmitibacter flavus TaxID=2576071 RepID=A0A5R8K9N8_9BACT|nr:hypothetical protein [Phragmitibacter flavus]TLD69023.1 hypothetical protein FEM03_19330 [Phragmitibacter flavus]